MVGIAVVSEDRSIGLEVDGSDGDSGGGSGMGSNNRNKITTI